MCTAMTLQTRRGDTFLGRTMDFSYPLDPELFIVPKGFLWNNVLNTHHFQNQYSFMGIGQDISPVTFADGVNEIGFSAAVLYFPGYAHFASPESCGSAEIPLAATELVRFLLGFSASVEHAASLLDTISLVGIADAVTQSVAPLHWLMADTSGKCMVIEQTDTGLHILDNPIGILSNSPDFPWHMTNLCNYMKVEPRQQGEATWDSVKLTPFGQGAGTLGLPGDYTPPARFVRAAYHKSHIISPSSEKEAVTACFHIMESVSIPKGSVITDRQTYDYTQYTAFMNLSSKKYFFHTYDNPQIITAILPDTGDFDSVSHIMSLGKLNTPAQFQDLSKLTQR